MEDRQIVRLFFRRSEDAIAAAEEKYGARCRAVARNILGDDGSAEECVSDALLAAWNTIPPQEPEHLGAYLARIARNLSLNRLKEAAAQKRGGGETALALEELSDCAAQVSDTDEIADRLALTGTIEEFLRALSPEKRRLFLRRYWYLCPIKEIARAMGVGESRIKSQLSRLRRELRTHLEKEGFLI